MPTQKTAMSYDYLSSTERRLLVESQLLMYEREYFTLTELVDEAGRTAQADRIAYLETEMARLRTLHDTLQAATTP